MTRLAPPWMNAPPGNQAAVSCSSCPLSMIAKPGSLFLDDVLRYTRQDHFAKLPGYVTFAPHWHLAYTPQAEEKARTGSRPFKSAMQADGIDAAMIMDFPR